MAEQAKVPAIRFAGFTDPWEQRKLGELVTTTIGGGTPSTSNPAYWDGEIPWIQSSNVLEDTLFDVDIPKAITQKGLEESAAQIVPENSIAVVTHVGVGKLIYLPFQYSTSQDFISLCGLKGDARYTCYALWKRLQEDLHIVQGSAIKGITKEDLLEKNLPMPSVEEQAQIGVLFSQLDNLITLHQRKYDKLVIFKKSMLEKMFPKDGESVPEIRFAGFTDPWEQRKLGELALTYSGGTPSAGNSAYYGGEIPFIRSAEIDCDSTELSLTVAGLNNSSAKLVDKGMVLYAMYGATSGEVAISKIKGAINQAILAMDASDMAANRFIAYWLRRQKKSITETFLQGGQGNLSGAIIKELGIPQPSLDEQRQIGSFFSNLDDLITLHQRKRLSIRQRSPVWS